MKFKALSSLIAASTIFVSVLPATAQYYPKSSINRSSDSTSVYSSGSSRTTSTSESNSSRVKVSLPGITNMDRKRNRSSSSSITRHKKTHTIHRGEYRALPFPGIINGNTKGDLWNLKTSPIKGHY